MDSEGKTTNYIVNSGKICISSKFADLIYNEVEKNQVLRIQTIHQELSISKVKELIELDDEKERNPYEGITNTRCRGRIVKTWYYPNGMMPSNKNSIISTLLVIMN